ncbi:MAG TPA: universal stress protein, partial [Anaerolineae bacterium]
KKILVCTAGDQPGLSDVEVAAHTAAHSGASVTVLHVMSQMPLSNKAYLPDLAATADELIARQTREGLHLQAALDILAAHSLGSTAKVRHGFVLDEILAETHSGNYDLLIIGAHRAHGLTRWLLADVAGRVIAEADLPVLVVRQQSILQP